MTTRSLQLRLGVAAGALIALALILGGAGLFLIFDRALDRRTADELNHVARFLAGQLAFDAGGAPKLMQTPGDPRFENPYGGLYWQVETARGQTLRSRSLWDKALVLPKRPSGETARHATLDLAAPDGGALIAVMRSVQLNTPPGAPLAVITVAMDRKELAESREAVLTLLAPSLVALGLVLALAMAAFVHQALKPFRSLRGDLREVHEGRAARLSGDYASEVRPLVDDLNRLIRLQEIAIGRARTQAGDVAHGLKTPLAVLDALARRIEPKHPALSAEIGEQSEAMREQVERSLARARSAAVAGLRKERCAVAPVVAQLVEAMSRLPAGRDLEWRVAVPASATYPASEGDVLEMLGNLIDNARKWARGAVAISADSGAITIEDDGPGMSEAEAAAIARGRRWDEATPGTGFGLAITRDLAEATGGRLELGRSAMGGLRATVIWSPTKN